MSPFDYVSVLISLILGLGITYILTGVAGLIKHWGKLKIFYPYLIWILLVFIMHIHEWWETYSLKNLESWSLPLFLFTILYPIILFILANLIFPDSWIEENFDLKTFYFLVFPKFFFFIILLSLVAILQNIYLLNYCLKDQIVQIIVLILFTGLLLWRTRNTIIHIAVVLLLLIILTGSLVATNESFRIE
jgi:hypothetical protein